MGTSMTSRMFSLNVTLRRYCITCFDREDTLECPVDQKAPWAHCIQFSLSVILGFKLWWELAAF